MKSNCLRPAWIVWIALSWLVALLPGPCAAIAKAAATEDAASASSATVEGPSGASWKRGELVPPLPADPRARAAAFDELKRRRNSQPERARTLGSPLPPQGSSDRIRSRVLHPVAGVHRGRAPRLESLRATAPPRAPVPRAVGGEDGNSATLPVSPNFHLQDDATEKRYASISFGGIDDTGFVPASTRIAAGIDHLGQVVNSRFAFYSKCGAVLWEQDFADFLGDFSRVLFTPRIVYDAWHNRWVMAITAVDYVANESFVYLMVSRSADPLSPWDSYISPLFGFASNIDLGVSPLFLYLTADQVPFGGGASTQGWIFVTDKSELYDNGIVSWLFWTGFHFGDGSVVRSIRCAKPHSYSFSFWLIAGQEQGGSEFALFEIDELPTPTLTLDLVGVSAYDPPTNVLQPDGTEVSCGDNRLTDAAYGFGQVWSIMAKEPPTSTVESALYTVAMDIETRQVSAEMTTGVVDSWVAYPALDLLDYDLVAATYAVGSSTTFLSLRTSVFGPQFFAASHEIRAGQANYAGGGSGTLASPYRWGDSFGCALDPFDRRTMWVSGAYASNSPIPSWDTEIGAVSVDPPGALELTEPESLVMSGYEGGPFSPPQLQYTLRNTGSTALRWEVQNPVFWQLVAPSSGQIAPGGSQVVTQFLGPDAYTLSAGAYLAEDFSFVDCASGTEFYPAPELHIGVDGRCLGSVLHLTPDANPTTSSVNAGEHGAYVTPLEDVDVCAIGFRAQLVVPQTVTARVYSTTADGLARDTLLAESSLQVVQPGEVTHFLPLYISLQACQDYDIAFEASNVVQWPAWVEGAPPAPFDAGGVLRVRDAEVGGNPLASSTLPWMTLLGSASCDALADLAAPGATQVGNFGTNNHGAYVTALQTSRVCSAGIEADLPAGSTLTTRIYDGTGSTRGALLAEGTLSVAGAGMQWHDVPVDVAFVQGSEYDVAFFNPALTAVHWDENLLSLPFDVDGAFQVVDGERSGNPALAILPHLRLGWSAATAGDVVDLGKPDDRLSATEDFQDRGALVLALENHRLVSIGWEAEVTVGSSMTLSVYQADAALNRGVLLAQTTTIASTPGIQWYEFPLALDLRQEEYYDIAVSWGDALQWTYWDTASGVPFDVNGARVLAAENEGEARVPELIHLRLTRCGLPLQPSAAASTLPSRIQFSAPAPNPARGSTQLQFSLDNSGAVELALYDVRGRRVRTLVDGILNAGAHAVTLSTRDLARGVYFARLVSTSGVLERKLAVLE